MMNELDRWHIDEGRVAEWEASRRSLLRLFVRVLGSPEGERLLTHLEEKFETSLPVFQGASGRYDPLDAMRRDAYREVFLHCRHQLKLAREEMERTPDLREDEQQ